MEKGEKKQETEKRDGQLQRWSLSVVHDTQPGRPAYNRNYQVEILNDATK